MGYSIFTDTMADMTWKEIEAAAKEKCPVLLAIGVIEEHGPHLPLGTDCYLAYDTCRQIKAAMGEMGCRAVIAPPFYWGINHVTGAFPGSFSARPETMKALLEDIFTNLSEWGFENVFCFNGHGDPLHIKTAMEAIKISRERLGINIRLVMEGYMLGRFHLKGDESHILPIFEEIPEAYERKAEDKGEVRLDIHAGQFETAAMAAYFESLVRKEIAKTLTNASLTLEELSVWGEGGTKTRNLVPDGYAGNPAEFEKLGDIKKIDQPLSRVGAVKVMESMGCKDGAGCL